MRERHLVAGVTVLLTAVASGQTAPEPARHAFLITLDGLRWQEVFRGAEDALISSEGGKIEKPGPVREEFWRESEDERRKALMPFFWNTIAKDGVLIGNRDQGSVARVENAMWFSYPGYSEAMCGFVDPAIDSNRKIPNPNRTVFEWLNEKHEYKGKVAGFGAWDVFPFIINTARSGIPVDDSVAPFRSGTVTAGLDVINRLKTDVPRRWSGGHFDGMVFRTAMEWIPSNRPRVVFLGLGETDEWGHEGDYAQYLTAARRCDSFIAELWEWIQKDAEYRGTTTLIITCDHGRGDGAAYPDSGIRDWNNHGAKHPGSDAVWVAAIGPRVPAAGECRGGTEVTTSQIAATLAYVLGEDYNAAEPRAAKPIPVFANGPLGTPPAAR